MIPRLLPARRGRLVLVVSGHILANPDRTRSIPNPQRSGLLEKANGRVTGPLPPADRRVEGVRLCMATTPSVSLPLLPARRGPLALPDQRRRRLRKAKMPTNPAAPNRVIVLGSGM